MTSTRILELLREYQKITGVAWKEEKVYIFLDEIHKLPGWSGQVKILYDALPNAKLVLSGSAGVLLQEGAESDLAGRYFLREIEVLSLREFAELYLGKEIDRLELWRGGTGGAPAKLPETPLSGDSEVGGGEGEGVHQGAGDWEMPTRGLA